MRPMPDGPEWGFLGAALFAVLDTADEGLVVFDGEGRCRMIGRRAGEIFGVQPAAYVGRPRDDVLRALAEACEEPEAFLEAVEAAPSGPAKPAVDVDVRRPRPRAVVCRTASVACEGRPPGRLIVVR